MTISQIFKSKTIWGSTLALLADHAVNLFPGNAKVLSVAKSLSILLAIIGARDAVSK